MLFRSKANAPKPNAADLKNAKTYQDALKRYGGNKELARAATNLLGTGGEKTSKIEDVLFGRGVSWQTAAKEATGVPQIGRGIEQVKTGKGFKSKLRGALDIGIGAFQAIGTLEALKSGGESLNARFAAPPVVAEGLALPAAGKTGKFGRV